MKRYCSCYAAASWWSYHASLVRGNITDILINLVVVALLVVQYTYLLSAAKTLAPAQWPELVPRFFRAGRPCATDAISAFDSMDIVLKNDKGAQPDCFLDKRGADELFTLMGLPQDIWIDLFSALDCDHDGVLRWAEVAKCHTGWGWACQNTCDDGAEAASRIGNIASSDSQSTTLGPSMWEITWLIEAWRRVQTLKYYYPSNKALLIRLAGSGLENRPALELL